MNVFQRLQIARSTSRRIVVPPHCPSRAGGCLHTRRMPRGRCPHQGPARIEDDLDLMRVSSGTHLWRLIVG
ncbi:uncharacterized protein METZ01_LOCUS409903, partial [marine metagenome]